MRNSSTDRVTRIGTNYDRRKKDRYKVGKPLAATRKRFLASLAMHEISTLIYIPHVLHSIFYNKNREIARKHNCSYIDTGFSHCIRN